MTRICVLGDSHIAALKLGWDKIASQHPNFELVFFADRLDGLKGMYTKDGILHPDNDELASSISHTSGGINHIDPFSYDLFLLYGLAARPNLRRWGVFYSEAVTQLALDDLVISRLSHTLLLRLREITDKPIYLGHVPLKAATQVVSSNKPVTYIEGQAILNKCIYHPLNAHLVMQPISTIVNGSKTDPKYTADSTRLEVGRENDGEAHGPKDRAHMNCLYGQCWLEHFFSQITSDTSQLSDQDCHH